MSTFAANTAEMRTKAAAVQATVERLRAEITSMTANLRELEGTWQGAAATNFQSVVADWHGTQVRVEESLASINGALARASQQYDDVESANARLFTY
ncbi:WXG100 family type VII secretion target [Zhihengliuella sp.]|uniref:WXG100 family type VII secretion target n=1 Tax=Zhihengliuella sp. TaxID=1954483 RepID=UPI00281210AE|nr:WXG100 family type VII secretion target [Zhihengliuella sp.]